MSLAKILGIYEIIAGIIGMGVVFFAGGIASIFLSTASSVIQGQATQYAWLLLVLIFLSLVFYVLAIVAGILLFRGKKGGKGLSIILHTLQFPIFTIGNVSYFLSLGLNFIVIFREIGSHISFNFRLFAGPQFSLSLGESSGLLFGLNFAAIILFILFWRIPKAST